MSHGLNRRRPTASPALLFFSIGPAGFPVRPTLGERPVTAQRLSETLPKECNERHNRPAGQNGGGVGHCLSSYESTLQEFLSCVRQARRVAGATRRPPPSPFARLRRRGTRRRPPTSRLRRSCRLDIWQVTMSIRRMLLGAAAMRRRTGLAVVVGLLMTLPAWSPTARADVITNSVDPGRSSWSPDEAALSPSTVAGGGFGELVAPAPVT